MALYCIYGYLFPKTLLNDIIFQILCHILEARGFMLSPVRQDTGPDTDGLNSPVEKVRWLDYTMLR